MLTSYLVETLISREATIQDIPQIQVARNSVKENQLSNAALISDKDCEEYIKIRGKGWVIKSTAVLVRFFIADSRANNTCLFIPEYDISSEQ